MLSTLVALINDESKWLTVSLSVALVAVLALLYRHRGPDLSARRRVLAAMSLFFGTTIGTMALGHLLAVTTKLAVGTLEGSLAVFYAIGVALALPSWWLTLHSWSLPDPETLGRRTVALNGWLVITLVALGVPNVPLAIPGALNVAYSFHQRRAVGWALVSAAAVVNLGLLVGSLIFLASGQSFEQFRGMQ
ncbi:MAG TPA: hypothetical protein VD793_11400 [Gemmatimonadales bacterium]|nr:hypothetical protein [Gemmatimonadales bacterium]